MAFTMAQRQAWLDGLFGSGTPASLRIRLLTGSSGSYTEVSVSGYSNAVVTNNRTNFPASAPAGALARLSNGTQISFGTPTGAVNGVTAYRVEDSSNASTVYVEKAFATSYDFPANSPIRFDPNTLAFTIANAA